MVLGVGLELEAFVLSLFQALSVRRPCEYEAKQIAEVHEFSSRCEGFYLLPSLTQVIAT
jgi:hypothetical protein